MTPSDKGTHVTELPRASDAATPLPPSHRWGSARSHLWLTLKLVPFHALNFVLGTAGFLVAITVLLVSILLLPLCGLGLLVYRLSLPLVRVLAVLDVMLANAVTDSEDRAHWEVRGVVAGREQQEHMQAPGNGGGGSDGRTVYGRTMAAKLSRFSWRSTVLVLYFASVKFVLALASVTSVAIPLLPIVAELVRDFASDTANSAIAGFDVYKFNFGTNPFLYFLTCVGYMIVGIVLMHIFGRMSRHATRSVCCQRHRHNNSMQQAV